MKKQTSDFLKDLQIPKYTLYSNLLFSRVSSYLEQIMNVNILFKLMIVISFLENLKQSLYVITHWHYLLQICCFQKFIMELK